jgi:hypothetical protein
MIERFGKAMGLRIPLGKNRQVELWYCPKGTKVPPHIHEHIDSFIVYLFGRMRVTVEHTTREVCGPVRRRESTGRLVWATRYIPKGSSPLRRSCGEKSHLPQFRAMPFGAQRERLQGFCSRQLSAPASPHLGHLPQS